MSDEPLSIPFAHNTCENVPAVVRRLIDYPVVVIVGHYGAGKTNFALNLALDAACVAEGDAARNNPRIALADMDVVNPYFRSSDYADELANAGVSLIAPVFAGTTLDSPSLSGAIPAMIDAAASGNTHLIIDAGGDDVGATALGRFAGDIEKAGYSMLYVINHYRNLTQSAQEAAALLREIEAKCHLEATSIVNNSHLKEDTTTQTVVDAIPFARETASLLGLPIACTAVPKALTDQKNNALSLDEYAENEYPVHVYVRTPWGS